MNFFRKLPLLLTSGLFITGPAFAADRILDFSSGCKIYKLDNRAWVATETAGFEGIGLSNSQVLKDEKFTVFRTEQGTFGVNQKCVITNGVIGGEDLSAMPAATPPPSRTAGTKKSRAGRRRSAGNPSYFSKRGPWSIGFSGGFNISPKGTEVSTVGSVSRETESTYSSSLSFMAEVDYRFQRNFRMVVELGTSQLQKSASQGNATSHFALRPEYVHRVSPQMELSAGPLLGLFFLAQNAESAVNGIQTIEVKQQTASALLMGLNVAADYALNEQFDVGAYLRYMKPGALVIKGEITPGPTAFDSKLSASYLTFGARFKVHF